MENRLKNFPLAIKLWILMACFASVCILLVSWFFYFELIHTSDETAFASIRKSQQLKRASRDAGTSRSSSIIPSEYDAVISVYHIKIRNGHIRYTTFPSAHLGDFSSGFTRSMLESFYTQSKFQKAYKLSSNDYNLYYIITKNRLKNSGIITFTINDADGALYQKATVILFFFSSIAILIALILSYIFSRHFAKPLQLLEQAAVRTASGDFDTPVRINRNDEVGKLSVAIDKARIELKKKDFLRQNAIQYVSHELKTPIMTILSYTQLISDGIYPLGDLDSSLKVIDEQAERMREIVMKLLTITRLDFLESRKTENQKFDLAGICEDTAYRLCASHHELELRLELEDVVMIGSKDQITVLAENLIENAVRHADNYVEITTGKKGSRPFLTVFNDGKPINEEQLSLLFEPFQKGKNGITGLGLSIVKRIIKNCGADIEVENKDNGVLFSVTFLPD